MIPLADAVAMTFIAPILVTLLSIPFLSEKVGIYRWCAALLGFAGVCVVAMPTGHGEMIGYMVAFASAFLSAIVLIQIRILGRTEHSLTMVFYSTLICLLISLGGAMMYWTPPGPADFLLL
jgi:drug/metabolite transporter (DMT)-like permease